MAYRDRDDLEIARAENAELRRKVERLTKKQEHKRRDWKAWREENWPLVLGAAVIVSVIIGVWVIVYCDTEQRQQAQNACQERAASAHCASTPYLRNRIGPMATCVCEAGGEYVVRWSDE